MHETTEHKARQIADMIANSRENFEHKARQLADIVAASSGLPPYGFEYEKIILKACRKSLIDGFPLQDYSLGEVPYGDKTGVLAYFENIAEYGMGENYNPKAHEIIFWCPYNRRIAVPNTMCNDGCGDYNEERPTCSEAVYQIEYPQKGRRFIHKIIGKILFNYYRHIYRHIWTIKRHTKNFFGRYFS